MPTYYAQVSYTGDGTTTDYAITFSFIDSSHVKAFIDGVQTTAFTIASSTLTFTSAPANASVVRIERQTPIDTRLVDFTDGSVLTESDLDRSADQNFFVAQEITDDSQNTMRIGTDDKWDAQSKVIKNVADPVNNNDAVNKQFISTNLPNITTVAGISSDVTTVAGISSNVTAVANDATDIGTVASNISSVTTVATNITDVVAVANDLAEAVSEVETVANDLNEATSEIDTVANSITNVDAVGTNISNVNTVAGISSNITTVAGVSSNVSTLAPIASDITSVAGISANVTTVAGVASNVTTVAGISSDVSTVAGANSNISTVAGAITNINNVGGSIANVNTVASNISGVNSFAERYRVQAGVPSSDNDTGDLVFDTTAGKLKVFDGSSYALAGSSVNGTSERFKYVATASQTTFSGSDANGNTLTYDVASGTAFADIYLNGVKLDTTDFTATDGTSIVLASGATSGDILQVVSYGTFTLASFSAGNLTSGTINIARIADGSITNAKLETPFSLTNPTITSISPDTITNSASNIVITGTNYVITPTVELVSTTGKVYFPNTVTRDSATQITINATIPDDGTYFIRIENPDGLAVRSSTALLTVSDAPTWSTSAGSLGSLAQGGTASFSISASSDSTVAYSVTSGALPTGLSLNSSTGAITGTESGSDTSETTYNFTVTATDQESQTADRAFSITVTTGINNGGQFN